jgi:hypothetical protein
MDHGCPRPRGHLHKHSINQPTIQPRKLGALPRAKPLVYWSGGSLIFPRSQAKLHVGAGKGQGQGPLQEPHRGEECEYSPRPVHEVCRRGKDGGGEKRWGARGDKAASREKLAAMLPRHAFVRGVAHHGSDWGRGSCGAPAGIASHYPCPFVWCVAGDAAGRGGGVFVESKEGQFPNMSQILERTPLISAASDGRVEDVKLLLKAGANASAKDSVREAVGPAFCPWERAFGRVWE